MTIRVKLIAAAALGLFVATSAIGDASAATIVKTVRVHTLHGTKVTKIITHRPNHVYLGSRLVRPVHFVHRAPVVTKVLRTVRHPLVHRHVATRYVTGRTSIR